MSNFSTTLDWSQYLDQILVWAGSFTPKIAGALLILILGWWGIGRITKLLAQVFLRTDFDEALEGFILSFVGIGLKVILLILIASMLGVQTTSLVAILGAAGLAVGLALQGSLANFAGGVLILMFRPFKLGDYIEAQGQSGTVTDIQIFSTILKTPDNKKVVLPNGNLANDVITNYTSQKERRINFVFGIGYGDDIKKAKKVLEKVVTKDARIINNKKYQPQIVVGNLGDSSVDLWCRVWVKTDDYWDVYFEKIEAVKLAFDQEGISIPFPQRDVHLIKD